MTDLHWLPVCRGWRQALRDLPVECDGVWSTLRRLANTRLDYVRTLALDAAIGSAPPDTHPGHSIRLAVMGSCTLDHLQPAIRVGGLRRGLRIETLMGGFGQYRQNIVGPPSALDAFRPDAVLLALDARHMTAGIDDASDSAAASMLLDDAIANLRALWRRLRDRFGCMILQQAVLPTQATLLGENEHRLPSSRAHLVTRLNQALRIAADQDGVDILAVDDHCRRDGVRAWHDPAMWHRAKQEIAASAVPMYGDLVARWLAARRGLSAKCLVLDLDNTLWGGVIGDDGLDGIALGPGSAEGEAFSAFQAHIRALSRRGVILAVCSKNDEARALEPFHSHPDMVLRREDIVVFVANWADKPANLRAIAAALDIGLDAMVFFDDSPVERDMVRRDLPMVAVPEPGEDPAGYPAVLADAGYFEALAVTAEDHARTALYRDNRARAELRASVSDLSDYLRGLDMCLDWRPFDRPGLRRITQLINKTNQFNLTTHRMTEAQVADVMDDGAACGLQFRLQDRFGDNGMIAVVILRLAEAGDVRIDMWLMSCRVLGREVEQATLAVLVARAKAMGADRLLGDYLPTARNGLVRDLYPRLGFTLVHEDAAGRTRWVLDLTTWQPAALTTTIEEGADNADRSGRVSGVDRDISRCVPA